MCHTFSLVQFAARVISCSLPRMYLRCTCARVSCSAQALVFLCLHVLSCILLCTGSRASCSACALAGLSLHLRLTCALVHPAAHVLLRILPRRCSHASCSACPFLCLAPSRQTQRFTGNFCGKTCLRVDSPVHFLRVAKQHVCVAMPIDPLSRPLRTRSETLFPNIHFDSPVLAMLGSSSFVCKHVQKFCLRRFLVNFFWTATDGVTPRQ